MKYAVAFSNICSLEPLEGLASGSTVGKDDVVGKN